MEIFAKGDDFPRSARRLTFRKKSSDFSFTIAYPDSAAALLPPGQDRHIATCTIVVPAGKGPLDVRVAFNLDKHGCVQVSGAEMMEPVVEEVKEAESKAEDKAGDGEEGKAGETKADPAVPPPPPKKRFRKIPLTINVQAFGIDKKGIKDSLELEASMANEDRLINETADKRNELESYIYAMRDKLAGVLKAFSTEAEKSALTSLLTESEEWLYGDGFDSVKSMYTRKLDDLRAIGDKIDLRQHDSENRPAALDGLKKQIEMCKAFAANREESHAHFTEDERDRIIVEAKGCEDWMYDMLQKQGETDTSAEPVLTVGMIQVTQNCHNLTRNRNPKTVTI